MELNEIFQAVQSASFSLRMMEVDEVNRILMAVADEITRSMPTLLAANRLDLERMDPENPKYDRLRLSEARLLEIASNMRDVAALPSPLDITLEERTRPNGLHLRKVSVPFGVVGIIYEARPNVSFDVSALCLKSGNAVAFKGGREATESIRTLFSILRDAAASAGIPKEAFVLMESREDINSILGLHDYIDLLIPRGSNEFVRYIQSNTKIPVLGHAAGICHLYVDPSADLDMACDVVLDSKTQYPAVCNALETLLVDASVAGAFLPRMAELFASKGVEVRGDDRTRAIIDAVPATEEDWDTEYGDLIISVRIVDSMEEAMAFINSHGSHHTDAIVTSDISRAARFVAGVDSADVFVNASTRFADGYRYGKGAEVGISTNKIHARGPVGMEGLMIYKYVLVGHGQVVKDYVGPDAKPFTHVPSSDPYPFGGE